MNCFLGKRRNRFTDGFEVGSFSEAQVWLGGWFLWTWWQLRLTAPHESSLFFGLLPRVGCFCAVVVILEYPLQFLYWWRTCKNKNNRRQLNIGYVLFVGMLTLSETGNCGAWSRGAQRDDGPQRRDQTKRIHWICKYICGLAVFPCFILEWTHRARILTLRKVSGGGGVHSGHRRWAYNKSYPMFLFDLHWAVTKYGHGMESEILRCYSKLQSIEWRETSSESPI